MYLNRVTSNPKVVPNPYNLRKEIALPNMALLLQRSSNSIASRTLTGNTNSTARLSNTRSASNQTPPKPDSGKDNVDTPGFSLKDLGMSPGVKVVVYGALAVIGTAETVTYGTWAYNKLYPKQEAAEESNERR